MKNSLFMLAFLLVTSVPACLYAQQQPLQPDAPPVNVNEVLTTLKGIKQKQQTDIKSTENDLAQQLMAHAQSATDALAYYENAVFATQFNGQSHESKEFQDWKKKKEAELRDPNFRNALCLHLMYLSLTVSHDAGVKTKDLLPYLLNYAQQVEANLNYLSMQEEFMTAPLGKSIFVRFLQIDQYVADGKTWEPIPVNIDGIFGKVILPEYRATKNANGLFGYWDDRISREQAAAASTRIPLDADKFTNTTRPALLWRRAHEYLALGLKNTAINEMLAIIKANPYHPDAPDWIAEVEKMVKPSEPPPAAATPVPVAPITPASTPTPGPVQN